MVPWHHSGTALSTSTLGRALGQPTHFVTPMGSPFIKMGVGVWRFLVHGCAQ